MIGILQAHETGAKCADLCHKRGKSEGTFDAGMAKYSGLAVSEARRLKAPEDENVKLKTLLAEQMLDMTAMKDLLSRMVTWSHGNGTGPKDHGDTATREPVAHLKAPLGLSERRVCEIAGTERTRCATNCAALFRAAAGFGVGVKLNSADFQKGGFDAADAAAVVRLLNAEAVDLVEISGGSYESPAMHGRAEDQPKRASTRKREAYFLDFARDIVAVATMPVLVTGGIRSRATAEDALAPEDGRAGVAMVGIAQALAYAPDLPNRWKGAEAVIDVPRVAWKSRLASSATMALTKLQLQRLGRGQRPIFGAWAPWVLLRDQLRTRRLNKSYRRWLEART